MCIPKVRNMVCLDCRSKLELVMDQLKSLAANEAYVHFPVDVRFVKRSSICLLSPHGDWDAVYFNILTWR